MKAPKEGSRKAEVFKVFHKDGLDAAIKHAVSIGLKEGTVKSWAGGWSGKSKPAPEAPAESGTERRPVKREAWSPHFKHESRAAAERHMRDVVRRSGTHDLAFHVIEEAGRFAVVPAHYKPGRPIPQFEKGDTVFDVTIPNHKGVVIGPGPEQSMVKYPEGERCVINYYLHKFEEEPEAKPAKKKRVKVEVTKPTKPVKKSKK